MGIIPRCSKSNKSLNARIKSVLKNLFFLGVGATLLYYAFYSMDMREVLKSLKNAHYQWVAMAFGCGILSHLSRSVRWRYLLNPLGYKLSVKHSFYAVMSGYLMNFIIPRLGEVSRCAMINRTDKIPMEKLIGTVVIERVVDLIITLLISGIILVTQYDLLQKYLTDLLGQTVFNTRTLYLLISLVIAGLFAARMVFKNRNRFSGNKLIKKAFDLWDGMAEGLKSIGKLNNPLLFIFHSLFIWCMYFMMSWLVFYSLDATSHLSISAGLTVLLAGTLAIIIPVPGGVGTYHTLVPAALLLYGINELDGKTYALISHSTQMLMIFVVGGICLILGGIAARKNIKAQHGNT